MKTGRFERHLKWYSSRWRARYGAELVALMEDTYGERSVPLSSRFVIMRTGAAERLREVGLGGGEETPGERVRSGSLLVLCGWALFVIAGSAFAKMTEHWVGATPQGDRALPTNAYEALQLAASVGLVIVLVAAAIALPAAWHLLRDGGWAAVRRTVGPALIISTATALLTLGLVIWAHHVGPTQRNGGLGTYLIGWFWALTVVASICTCTLTAAAVSRHLRFSEPLLRLEGLLAVLLTLAMATILGGALVWAVSIANNAPRVLSGSQSGLFGVPGPPTEIITGLLMLAGLILGVGGAGRVARSIRSDPPDTAALPD
jgi:hypothetical protein